MKPLLISIWIVTLFSLTVESFNFKFSDHTSGFSGDTGDQLFFFCPLIDGDYKGKTIPLIGDTNIEFKAVNCFDINKVKADAYSAHTIVFSGSVTSKPDLYDSIRGSGTYVRAKVINIYGQIIVLVQANKGVMDDMKLTISKNGKDVVWMDEKDYLTKNYCSNFIKRMAKAHKDKNFDEMRKISEDINTCTSKVFWDRLDQNAKLKDSKDKIFSKSIEVASKMLALTEYEVLTKIIEVSSAIVEFVEKVEPTDDKFLNVVLEIYQQYRIPLELYLKFGQSEGKFAKADKTSKSTLNPTKVV